MPSKRGAPGSTPGRGAEAGTRIHSLEKCGPLLPLG
jgi:hypothetical protein